MKKLLFVVLIFVVFFGTSTTAFGLSRLVPVRAEDLTHQMPEEVRNRGGSSSGVFDASTTTDEIVEIDAPEESEVKISDYDPVRDALGTVKEALDRVEEVLERTEPYVVSLGDYLWDIARRLLGDGSRWREIVEANKDKYPSLVKNPDLIHPGWVLEIPTTVETERPVQAPESESEAPGNVQVEGETGSDAESLEQVGGMTADEKIEFMRSAFHQAATRLARGNMGGWPAPHIRAGNQYHRELVSTGSPEAWANYIRWMIDQRILDEEQWMDMNPPAGYHWGLDSDGQPTLLPVDGASATDDGVVEPEVAAEPEVVAEPEVAAEPEVVAEPEVTAEPEVVAEPEVTAEPEEASEGLTEEQIEQAETQARTQYENLLNDIGIPDFADDARQFRDLMAAARGMMRESWWRSTGFDRYHGRFPDVSIPRLQRDLRNAQEAYEKAVAEGKTSRFLGVFGTTIESAARKVERAKNNLERHWENIDKALQEAKSRAQELENLLASDNRRLQAARDELAAIDNPYDTANASLLTRLNRTIDELEGSVADSESRLAEYRKLERGFNL